ncbi:tRNA dimethylallyltransferase [Trichinella spiralis]|uniref:tRNA dimethylallyltransferase n=1 Tax=Trichinella spiralis TaxID=6334 RepID=A0ABR3K2G6_TRISP
MFALWARPSQDLQKALQLLTGCCHLYFSRIPYGASFDFDRFFETNALLDEKGFLLNGLPTSNCMQGHNLVDLFQASSFSFISTALRSSISEYHMELHLISIASLKPVVSQQASWCFCWFENSHPVA